ncbi:D-tyrosyl-tRNA(Tyr) deacylase [bacterium]|nr:D-tyrosyl-tRNA(Tyr) deacylase [bacterium]
MIGVVQRVERCSVSVDESVVASIGHGLLILLGVHHEDTEKDIQLLARKCIGLRIFSDDEGKMNLSVTDIAGEIVIVSQFTLFGDVKRGLRPYFGEAAAPEKAVDYYNRFTAVLSDSGVPVKGGIFGAHMHVELVNDGPVTIVLNTREL